MARLTCSPSDRGCLSQRSRTPGRTFHRDGSHRNSRPRRVSQGCTLPSNPRHRSCSNGRSGRRRQSRPGRCSRRNRNGLGRHAGRSTRHDWYCSARRGSVRRCTGTVCAANARHKPIRPDMRDHPACRLHRHRASGLWPRRAVNPAKLAQREAHAPNPRAAVSAIGSTRAAESGRRIEQDPKTCPSANV
jgi:hypothetical protein